MSQAPSQPLTHAAQLRQILTARRRTLKLTQGALAAKLGISQNRLSEIEADPGNLGVERLLDLCNLLGLNLVIEDRAASATPVASATPAKPKKGEW